MTGQSFYDLQAPTQRVHDPNDSAAAERKRSFLEKMDDDFNTGAAVSELFELARIINRAIDQNQLEDPAQRNDEAVAELVQAATTLKEMANLLGIFQQPVGQSEDDQGLVDSLMQLLIRLRAEARQKKDFATSDGIRDGLAEIGIVLEDRKDGTGWKIQ